MNQQGSELFDEVAIARRRLRKWLVMAAGVSLLVGAGGEFVSSLRGPDLALLNAWQALRGTDTPSPQVVIVAIDEKSIARFGPSALARSAYVPLIEKLTEARAQMIGLDVTFGAIEREAEANEQLARAMSNAGNVVFGFEFTDVGDPTPPGTPPSEAVQRSSLPRSDAGTSAIPSAPGLIAPEPVLSAAAAAMGHVAAFESEDGRIRTLPLAIRHGDKVYPSLALQMARVYTGTSMEQVGLRDGMVAMGDWSIPVSASGEVLLNWPGAGEQAFAQYSFLDVVRGDVSPEAFRGKAVLVGGTAKGLDDRDLPFAVEAPGVLLHATFLDNVFRVDFVKAPIWAWLLEWGLLVAVCLLTVWLLPRLPTPLLLAGVPALVLLLLGGSAVLYMQAGVWVKVVFPCFALLLPMALVVARRLTQSERATRDFAAENVESQKLLGLSFQEKGMLDMALATFNKLPFTQDMKLVYVNLGVDFENRGQREKALLVYNHVLERDRTFEDVAHRIERLSHPTGAGSMTLPAPGQPATVPGAAGYESPLSHLLPTQVPSPTQVESPTEAPSGLSPTLQIPSGPSVLGLGGAAAFETNMPTAVGPPPALVPSVSGRTGGAIGPPSLSGSLGAGSRFGRFVIERHIGRGGMGDVSLVRDTVMNPRAALKTIRPDTDLTASETIEMRQRFYREAQTAGKLTHPNIVTIYDVGEALGMSYIVMEFVEGETLTRLMKRQRLSMAQLKHVIYHAGIGLDYAHASGVYHRDVMPENNMVSSSGGLVKVMDFGIARVVESSLTKTGSVIGTPAYMSPEQVNGQKVDARSDIFSLGVILYELLTGRKPFGGESVHSLMFAIIMSEPAHPSSLDTKVDPAWDEILSKALAKNREDRYATAREFAQAVADVPVR